MSSSICVRQLTEEEEKYFRKSDLGRKTVSLGPMSIMGPADHSHIKCLNIDRKTYRVDLGGGQYIDELLGPWQPPIEGKAVQVVWGAQNPHYYLLAAAEKLDIPFFHTSKYRNYDSPLYFQSVYADVFLESFSYADRAFDAWYNNRSFLARWFGGMQPEPNSNEANAISEEIRRILAKAKKSK
jgi:hypothetical protein